MTRLFLLCGLATLFLCGNPVTAAELGSHLLSVLSRGTTGSIPVIITLKPEPGLEQVAPLAADIRTRKGERRRLARMHHLRQLKQRTAKHRQQLRDLLAVNQINKVKSLWLIDSVAAELPPNLIDEVAAQPEVLSVRYDRLIDPPASPAPAAATATSNLNLIKAPDLWNLGLTGQGVTIALMDTGVDVNHPDLQPSYRGGTNSWYNAIAATDCPTSGVNNCDLCDADTSQPCDSTGHGTAVAGVLVGGSNSGQTIGVTSGAQWIATKIFKSDDAQSILPQTQESAIHLAFQWLLDPDNNPATDDAPDVLNASWGFSAVDGCLLTFEADVQALRNAGIAVVFSAGNDGPAQGSDVSPANNANSYAVGSVGAIGDPTLISDFSSRGPSSCNSAIFPDIVAPGFSILTADISLAGSATYLTASGTSFSAPHITGVMALLRGQGGFPGASVKELEDALRLSAADLGPAGPDNDYGYGLVDAKAAYDLLLPPAPALLSPADQSSGLATDITLTWKQPLDALGAAVSNTVLLDTDPNFSSPRSFQVTAALTTTTPASYAMFGLSALLLPLGLRKKYRAALLLGVALILFTLLSACGGGGSSTPAPDPTLRSLDVTGLTAGTTYYWKVEAQTPRGGPVSDSGVWSFGVK
ncbi:S8 family serine peptidase [Geothermobacter hydrogeniphilus]|uniref:Uncharacterized protein n=1 Tax=Geothermobacter hydrogeniphilus TaxID=1969733 RepID=A0A1X0Y105_9BACT|nr:S8 family serine peptidase [Geothermobacter hydrogeniphilus]ORJ58768.1 hypothetical protein B5V00_11775 [Geothermobacter hydrogeniphilus]